MYPALSCGPADPWRSAPADSVHSPMGMLIDYYCGAPTRIAQLYVAGGQDLASDPAVVASCDFSIHFYPEWLDVLHDLLATGAVLTRNECRK